MSTGIPYVDEYSEDSLESFTSEEDTEEEEDNQVIDYLFEKEILEFFMVYDQHYLKFIKIDGLVAETDPNYSHYLIKRKLISESVEVNQRFLQWISNRYDSTYHQPPGNKRYEKESSEEEISTEDEEIDVELLTSTISNTNLSALSPTHSNSNSNSTSTSTTPCGWDSKEIVYKIYNLLLLFVRDWSDEGAIERECYIPFIEKLRQLYPDTGARDQIKIACPGGGMGRLAYEIAHLGFETIQNELSIFLVVALKSIFIKDKPIEADAYSIRPFIHSTKSLSENESIMKEIKVPNIAVDTGSINLKFEHGNFYKRFRTPASLDCICTSFFIDVVPDVLHLIKHCRMLLKSKGVWINNGPLYYNHSKKQKQLSHDQLLAALEDAGFTVTEHSLDSFKYTKIDSNSNSVEFSKCLWFVATVNHSTITEQQSTQDTTEQTQKL